MIGGQLSIGIVSARGQEYFANGRLLEVARDRGHNALLVNPHDHLRLVDSPASFNDSPLGGVDIFIPRQGATISPPSLVFLDFLGNSGALLVNSPAAIKLCRDKLLTLEKLAADGLPTVRTASLGLQTKFKPGDFPLVVKPNVGRKGREVELVKSADALSSVIQRSVAKGGQFIVQPFVPNDMRTDLRLVVVGGEVVGTVEMTPQGSDFRANLGAGGHIRSIPTETSIAQLALAAAQSLDLEVCGVDIFRLSAGSALISEVNYSPGFKGFEAATDIDCAGLIIDYAAAKAYKGRHG